MAALPIYVKYNIAASDNKSPTSGSDKCLDRFPDVEVALLFWGAATSGGHASADPGRGETECTLVTGLRARSVRLRPTLPGAQHRRRRDARMPPGGGGHVDLGPSGRARTGRSDRRAGQAEDDRQRQRPMLGSSGGFWPADIHAPTTVGAACNLSQMAPTVNGIAPCHSKHRIQRRRGGRGPHRP